MLPQQNFEFQSRNLAQAMNADRLDIAASMLQQDARTNPREALALIQREVGRERVQPSAGHINVRPDGNVFLQDGTRSVLAARIPPQMAQQLAMQGDQYRPYNPNAAWQANQNLAYNPNLAYTNPNLAYTNPNLAYTNPNVDYANPNLAYNPNLNPAYNRGLAYNGRTLNTVQPDYAALQNPNYQVTNPNYLNDGVYRPAPPGYSQAQPIASDYVQPVQPVVAQPYVGGPYGPRYGAPDPGRAIAGTIGAIFGGLLFGHHRPYCPPPYYGGYGYGYPPPMAPIVPFFGMPHRHRW
jgi:hypothetical protein